MSMTNSELYLFLIWENARTKENYLLQEIQKEFEIRDIYEITWDKKIFSNNMMRFYGPTLPAQHQTVSEKTKLCGTGSFLLIIISDENPKFGRRRSSSNGMMEVVNLNLFENKRKYRKLTGVPFFAIHSSLTKKETNDNLTLLLGKNTSDVEKTLSDKWNGKITKIESNIVGQSGWKDLKELLYVLNSTSNYVILRNFEGLPENFDNYSHNDVDILTDDFLRMPYLANGGKSPINNIFSHIVQIGNKKIPFDYGFPGDGYYDEKWSKEILERRVFCNGFYVPADEDYFYSLFYHAIFYQKKVSDEYKTKLLDLAKKLFIDEISVSLFDDIEESTIFLETYMKKMGYLHTNSFRYKILHNKILHNKIFLMAQLYATWKKHGIQFLFTAIKRKIK